MKVEHIGIAVKTIDEQLKVWQHILGLKLHGVEEVIEQKVKVAMLEIGDIHIELLEAIDEESTIKKFIESRGEGLHHICIKVINLDDLLKNLKSKGVKLIDETPRIGAKGKKIAFIHPKNMGGVLIELCQE